MRELKKKYNYKLTEEDKKQIVVEYYLNRSTEKVQELCDRYGISNQRVYQLVRTKSGKDILEKYINESRNNFSKNLDLVLEKALKGLNEKLEKEDIKALDYAKILGITYDKSRLEHNLSTSNTSININIKVEK